MERGKKAAIFLFLVLNGTWVLIAYLLRLNGVRPIIIAVVVAIGVLLGNLAAYAGVRLAGKIIREKKRGSNFKLRHYRNLQILAVLLGYLLN